MDLTREEALKLHRQMWTDMQKELGDCPTCGERINFKGKWVSEKFPGKIVLDNCFLCEYNKERWCSCCPINWGRDGKFGDSCSKSESVGVDWRYSPISEIMALPEREDV